MAYNSNPFLERMSERTTSDMEFVRLFSPKILEKLAEDAFEGAVHMFRSAPVAGMTTLLRAFTPSALRAFWNSRARPELAESFQKLVNRGVLTEGDSPQLLGVFLSCLRSCRTQPIATTVWSINTFVSVAPMTPAWVLLAAPCR